MTVRSAWPRPVPVDTINRAPSQPSAFAFGNSATVMLAREIYAERRRRRRFFDEDLFGEPSWDILLDLYIALCDDRAVPTTSACIGSNVPPTTALRWLRILEARGLVERRSDDADGRRTFVALSDKGRATMEAFLDSTRMRMLLDYASFAEAEAAQTQRIAAE